MGFSQHRLRAFGLAVVLATSGTAQAAELLHMPYDCRLDGARVIMRPALEDRSYAIVGAREKEIFSSCAPGDPENCRTWFVHRFTFDCEGMRVSWLEAAGAAARGENWDAWVEDGSFRMRMNRRWGVAAARPLLPRRWRRGPFAARDDEDPFGPGGFREDDRFVTLPPGFAPAMGIPLNFTGTTEPVARAPAPSAPAPLAQAPEPVPAARAAPEAAPAVPELPERAPRQAASSAPPAADAKKAEPAAATKVAGALDAASPSAETAKDKPGPAAAKTDEAAPPTAQSMAPTILNAPQADAPVAPSTEPAAGEPKLDASPQEANKSAAQEARESAPPPAESAATAKPDAGTGSEPPADTAALPSAPATEEGGSREEAAGLGPGGAVGAALALAGLAAFGIWSWRRAGRQPSVPAERDISKVSFGDAGAQALLVDQAAHAAREEFPVPTSYEQALALLDAGPQSPLDDIKKKVDALRRTWHPDHARSEADRTHRERRLQQINVAWDLVSRRRTAA